MSDAGLAAPRVGPVRCDVIVAGGGGAGLAAAVAAARAGARTLLVERHGALGGMATAALVHSVCGLYLLRREPGAALANPGFPAELAARLVACGGAPGPLRIGQVDVLPHHPPAFAWLADQIARAEPELEVRLHSELIGARVAGDGAAVELVAGGRRELVEARVLVDASGDAAAAVLAGAEVEQTEGRKLQRPAFVFALGGVDGGALDDARRLAVAHRIAAATRTGALPASALGASLRPSTHEGEAYVTLNLAGPPGDAYDPTDPRCLTELAMEGRALAARMAAFLRAEIEGFARSFVAALPARVGVRESRRVVGSRRLEATDLETGARFADAVALATWPMEMRETATGARLRFPADERPCEIPLGSLRARGRARLLVAGRCISASHEAQASIRVIGTCLATGEAAGLAAALLADGWRAPASADAGCGQGGACEDAAAGADDAARENDAAGENDASHAADAALAAAVVAARDRLMRPRAAAAAVALAPGATAPAGGAAPVAPGPAERR